MSNNPDQKTETESRLERRKQALRDNLSRRKSQIRELASDDQAELKIRQKKLKPVQTSS